MSFILDKLHLTLIQNEAAFLGSAIRAETIKVITTLPWKALKHLKLESHLGCRSMEATNIVLH